MQLPWATHLLLGFLGPRAEAEEIKGLRGEFLQTVLKLELSDTKTLLTHASTGAARFLDYEVSAKRDGNKRNANGHRSLGGALALRIPANVVQEKCKPYMQHGKPIHLKIRTHNAVFSIIAAYQAEYRGIVNYWRMAINLRSLGKLRWIMETSLVKPLANKLKLRGPQVYKRYRVTINTPNGPQKGLQTLVAREGKRPRVATWGGIPLTRNIKAPLHDNPSRVWNGRSELIQRLLADTCALCGAQGGIAVHHIRARRDLRIWGRKEPPEWVQVRAARRRKTLMVCLRGHHEIHRDGNRGDVTARRQRKRASGEPEALKGASPVLRGG